MLSNSRSSRAPRPSRCKRATSKLGNSLSPLLFEESFCASGEYPPWPSMIEGTGIMYSWSSVLEKMPFFSRNLGNLAAPALALGLFAACGPTKEAEPNDSYQQATVLKAGKTANGTIANPKDQDW